VVASGRVVVGVDDVDVCCVVIDVRWVEVVVCVGGVDVVVVFGVGVLVLVLVVVLWCGLFVCVLDAVWYVMLVVLLLLTSPVFVVVVLVFAVAVLRVLVS